MFDRMTDRARKAMELSRQESQRLSHDCIMPEHILLGLIKHGAGVAVEVLKKLGVDLRELREAVEEKFPPGKALTLGEKLPYTKDAKGVLERAFQAARELSHNYIGTEHLLLGLLAGSGGVAAEVLSELGLTLEAVREGILEFLNTEFQNVEPTPEAKGVGPMSGQPSVDWKFAPADKAEGVIHIGARRQLFIDWKFVTEGKNVGLTVNPPTKAGQIDMDIEQDSMISIVEHGGQYFMYLRTRGEERGVKVAVSADGLQWRGVEASAFGSGRTLPLPGVDSGSVFLDPKEQDYPFKGVFDIREAEPWGLDPSKAGDVKPVHATRANARGGLHLFRSRDGFQWELVPGLPVPFLCDTQNQVLYDPRIDRYVAYLRAFPTLGGPHDHKRCVARTEIEDLYEMPWPHEINLKNEPEGDHEFPYIQDEMPIILAADKYDPARADLYNPMMHTYPWAESVYLAFPSLYNTWGYSNENISHGRDHRGLRFNDGLFETHLAVSRDGTNFTRYRSPYIPSGLVYDREGKEGELDCGLIYMGIGMIRHGDEIWQYYFGSRRTHMSAEDGEKYGLLGEGIFRAVQRLDGFVSVDSDYVGGGFVTPPITFEGDRLMLNAGCHGLGGIVVEIQDLWGKPLDGYTLDDTVTIVRNGVNQEIWWKAGPDVGELAGKPIRLNFRMRSAKLYAFQFVNSQSGVQDAGAGS